MKTKPRNKQLKLDDLPDIERETLEIARDNIAAMEKVVKPTMAQEFKRIWVAMLTQRGVSADHALKLLEIMPELDRMQRLLSANEGILREFLRELRTTKTNEGDRP